MKIWYWIFCINLLLLGTYSEAQIIVVKPNGKEPVLKIGGLLQVQADVGDRGDSRFTTGDDRFYLRRARLNASGNFLEDFDFKLEMDLFGSLSNSPTSISSANVRAQLTDGYINWNKLTYANVRGGQFKTPYGFEQIYLDPRLFTIERSLVNDRLTVSRQLGAMVSGDVLEKRISYSVGLFNGNNVNNSFNDNDKFLYAGRFQGTIWGGNLHSWDTKFSAGINGFASEDKNLTGQSADFQFTNTTLPESGEASELILNFVPVLWKSGSNICETGLNRKIKNPFQVLRQMDGIYKMFLRSVLKFRPYSNMKLFVRLQKSISPTIHGR